MDPNWTNLLLSLVKDFETPEATSKYLLSLQKAETSYSPTPNPDFHSALSTLPRPSHPTPSAQMAQIEGTQSNVAKTEEKGLNVEPISMILPEDIAKNPDDVPINALYSAKADGKRAREKSASPEKEKDAPVMKKAKTSMADTAVKTQQVPFVDATREESTHSPPKTEKGFGVGDAPEQGEKPSSTTELEEHVAAKTFVETNITEEDVEPTWDVAAEALVGSEDDVQVIKETKSMKKGKEKLVPMTPMGPRRTRSKSTQHQVKVHSASAFELKSARATQRRYYCNIQGQSAQNLSEEGVHRQNLKSSITFPIWSKQQLRWRLRIRL